MGPPPLDCGDKSCFLRIYLECQNIAHLAKQAWRLLKEEETIWAKILKAIYYPNCSLWKAREGRNASWVWKSLLEGRNFLRRKGKLRRCEEDQIRKVIEIIKQGEGWDENRIKKLFPRNIAGLIIRTPISLINKEDNLIWPYRVEGQYSVKSGYRAAKEEKDAKEETKLNEASSSQNFREVIINAEYLAAKFHNTTTGSSTDHNASRGKSGDKKRITWRPPPQNRLKVNTDAAFQRDTGKAASAVVVRNWQGKIITGTTSKFITTSALAAEAQAYREALILIKNLQIENCIIETDCLPLVQAVKARTPIAEVDAILRDILQLLEEAPDVGATWTPREGNIVAHQLAAMAVGNVLRSQWTVNAANPVRNTIRTEARFAILQHNQRMQNQINGNPISTDQQGIQTEEDLPDRVENWDMQEAEGGEQHQPSASQRLKIERSNRCGEAWRAGRVGCIEGLGPMRDASRQRNAAGETYCQKAPGRTHYQRRQNRTGEENGVGGDLKTSLYRIVLTTLIGRDI
ncbi:hypothetical protein Ahy_B04g073535 [Arachis hypogaea]|uniref:RNase H type-1 domain-containing protein n=1 Tax=Arachis hypogaea TaxID=3818 RepID=A0A444ZQX5_ARAHY|nr:hypothetical protein Ahy_B04g073535 [Arachis hypogaea]